ncbi:MAG: hypothetical protein WC654_05805 [Patescibacteria group bacterium]
MSTHNLSRSVIEGGRTGNWQFSNRANKRRERRIVREKLRDASLDNLDIILPPRRHSRDRRFNCRSTHINVWLAAQVGREWDAVWSEVTRLFDRRRLRHWSLVDQHMKKEKKVTRFSDDNCHGRFIVDEQGILCSREDFQITYEQVKRTAPKRPATWPTRSSDYTSLENLTGEHLLYAYLLVEHGRYLWVTPKTWHFEQVWNKKENEMVLIRHAVTYAIARELTQEELDHLLGLHGFNYRNLNFREAKRNRRIQNSFWRPRDDLPPLPEVELVRSTI